MGRDTQGFARLSPAQRSLAAAVGSLTNWSRRTSKDARAAGTAKAREARRRNLEIKADPGGVLSPDELAAAVARLQRAHMRSMALKSAERRARAA